jgi:hypothetical protein
MASTADADEPRLGKVRVGVMGDVARPGVFELSNPTIEGAFKAAGGWDLFQLKEDHLRRPSSICRIYTRKPDGNPGPLTIIKIRVDRKTGRIEVVDPEYKHYRLTRESF